MENGGSQGGMRRHGHPDDSGDRIPSADAAPQRCHQRHSASGQIVLPIIVALAILRLGGFGPSHEILHRRFQIPDRGPKLEATQDFRNELLEQFSVARRLRGNPLKFENRMD